MSRLDARVKTEIPALVTQHIGGPEEEVIVQELSLSNLLMKGWTPKVHDTLRVKMTLPKGNEVEVFGDSVRVHDSDSALRLYCPEYTTTLELWKFIKTRIHYLTTCPYCNQENESHSDHCATCGLYLNFDDQNYIDKHIQETFLQRINRRIGKMSSDYLQRVLTHIDREELAAKGMSMDEQFIGTSKTMLEVFSLIRKFALVEGPVLILGESGTGKDLAARAIHERSDRSNSSFVVINCAAIPEGLLEAELFGYEKGAFTGAYMNKKGKFELAHGGTVFLDEIGELPLPLQAKLLRVLEDQRVERLGSKGSRKVDVRIIAATNKNLEQEVMSRRFRVDLYHRINTFTITLSPLRNRGEDKEVIAKYYLAKFCAQEGVPKRFSKEAIETINMYSWPGNVRELINKVRRAIVVSEGDVIVPCDLSTEVLEDNRFNCIGKAKTNIEKQHLVEILRMTSKNISKASRLLGVSRPTLYTLLKKYDLNSAHKS